MSKRKPNKLELEWLPLPQCAAVMGMTPQGFHKSLRPLLVDADVRTGGVRGAVHIHMPSVIAAYVRREVDRTQPAADPLLVGQDSPSLEQYRLHRARLAQMDVEAREKTHADLTQLDAALANLSSIMRRATETLQRRFGNDAAGIISEALDEAGRQWEDAKGGK